MKILEEKGYSYEKHLSTGGEGEVHLVKSVGKLFIAKIIPQIDRDAYELLENIGNMNISHIPKIHEIFNYEDKTIIVRDYVEGNTLCDEIRKNGSLSFGRAKEILFKICDTIKALHGAKPDPIIHRDLKPDNIIVMPNGDVMLIDFGIARHYKAGSAHDTVLAGTRGYTAPEVMAGMQSNERSDIYSLGMLFYEMLTGKNMLEPPYQIRPVAEAGGFLPSWLDAVIERATDIRQVNRYKSVADFVRDIENPDRLARKKKAKLAASIAALAALMIIATGVLYATYQAQKFSYDMLLDLEFDNAQDQQWVSGYEDPEGRFAFFNGQLHVMHEGCKIDFPVRNGMLAHFKVEGNNCVAVGIGPYRMNVSGGFECFYYDEQTGTDYTTWNSMLYGLPVKSNGNFIDIVIYTTLENDAVYAFAIDEKTGNIGYTSYKIPGYLDHDILDMVIYNFNDNENLDGNIIAESIKVAEGSLKGYLKNNFTAYKKNKKRVDEFLQKDISALPDMVFLPSDEWQ